MAESRERAEYLLGLAEDGTARFETSFGRQPSRYAVVEGRDAVTPRATIEALRKAGFPTVLPWLSDSVYRAQIEQALRPSIAAQMAGQPAERIEAAVAAAIAQQVDSTRRSKVELAAVPHELGHDWFRTAYWPDVPIGGAKHYGGPSPDWLDEMSAVLMEAPEMFDERIVQFRTKFNAYRAAPEAADENSRLLIDLTNYFHEEHPSAAQVRALDSHTGAAASKQTVQLLTGDSARKIAESGVRFYLQSAVVSQYLIDRTGDQKIFDRIAKAFVRGETIEQWLANSELKGSLPRDLTAMQADWLSWLEGRFPKS